MDADEDWKTRNFTLYSTFLLGKMGPMVTVMSCVLRSNIERENGYVKAVQVLGKLGLKLHLQLNLRT